MYIKIFFHLLLSLLISLIQISFIQSWMSWLGYFNLVLVALIFVLSLSGLDKALLWAGTAGFIHDIYSFLPFGLFISIFILSALAANLLLKSFLTDRSLFSFWGLILLVLFVFNFLFYSGVYVINLYTVEMPFFLASRDFWIYFLRGSVFSLVVVFVFFYSSHFISNRLNAVFLKH